MKYLDSVFKTGMFIMYHKLCQYHKFHIKASRVVYTVSFIAGGSIPCMGRSYPVEKSCFANTVMFCSLFVLDGIAYSLGKVNGDMW